MRYGVAQGLGEAWIAQPNETHASNGQPLTAAKGLRAAQWLCGGPDSEQGFRDPHPRSLEPIVKPLFKIPLALFVRKRRPDFIFPHIPVMNCPGVSVDGVPPH
jgi:hypothetical protein